MDRGWGTLRGEAAAHQRSAAIGRDSELTQLGERFRSGAIKSALIVGDRGMGKSLLARRVAESLNNSAGTFETITATAAAQKLQLGAFAHLLPAPTPAAGDMAAVVFPHVAATLAGASVGPWPLVVDDVHLLDETSAALLLHLVATNTVRLVMTARSYAPLPDPVTALERGADCAFVELAALSADETASLASLVLGGRVSDHTLTRVRELTAGNPHDIYELACAVADSGGARTIDGFLYWTEAVPRAAHLAQTIESRLTDLSPHARDALAILAVALPLGMPLVEDLVDDAALVELEHARLVRPVAPHRAANSEERRTELELSSRLMAEVTRLEIPSITGGRYRRRIATLVEDAGCRRSDDLIRVATLRLDADGTGDHRVLARASRRATLGYDNRLGQRLAAASLDAGGGPEAALALAFALNMRNEFEAAESVMAKWWSDSLDADQERVARPYVFQRVLALHRGLGRLAEAERCVHDAASHIDDVRWRQRIRGLYAYADSMVDFERASGLALPLIEDPACDPLAKVYAIQAVVSAHNLRGMTEDALVALGPILPVSFAVQDIFPRAPGFVYGLRTAAYLLAGRIRKVEASVDKFLARQHGGSDQQALGAMLLTKGLARSQAGRLDEAVVAFERSLQHLNRSDPAVMRPRALTRLSIAHAQLGAVESAAETLSSAREYLATRGENQVFLAELDEAEAWLAAASGDLEHARDIALNGARRTPLPVHRVILAFSAYRLGADPDACREHIEVDAERMQAPLMLLHVDQLRASLAPNPAAVFENVGARYNKMGLELLAAESWIQAAEAHTSDSSAARRCAKLAQDVLLQLQPSEARTPITNRLTAPSLTKRERAVGAAAARGLTNDEIATELGRSTRTVEWHLQNLYAKLAVAGRNELAAIFPADR